MKNINDASHLFIADVKKDQTVKFISFDLIRSFRNHFLINSVFQDIVYSKPTKYFSGEAEAFLLTPILQMLDSLRITGRKASDNKNPFNDVSVANTLMKMAQNAANFSAVMDISKSSYYAGRAFSEQTLASRLQADWSLENNLVLKNADAKKGSEDTSQVNWMATLFGQQLSRIAITTPISTDLTTWENFATKAITVLGLGPGFYTEQRNISTFIEQRSAIENSFYGINFPGFHELENADDAFYILALMYLDYCHVTSSPEMYQTVMRPEAPNTPARMDAMATRAKRFMKYYAAMAIAPRFMSMYAKYLLMKDLNSVLAPWTDNEISNNKDMIHKMGVIEKLCATIVPQRFLKHTEDIIRWFKDFYGVSILIPDQYSILADFKSLKSSTSGFQVKPGDPIIQSVVYRDKILYQKDLMNLCNTRDAYIDLMYNACLSLDTTVQQIDKSITTIQSWDEFSGLEIPTIPAATEFGSVKFADPTKQDIINDAIPRNAIDYVHADKGGVVPNRTFMGNVDVKPILKDLVYATVKPHAWIVALRKEKFGLRPSSSHNPSDVRITFTNDHTLYIGSRPMAHYAEMPIPVDYLAYADPMCVDPSISGLLSILQTLPSPYKALSDYFSAAATQFDMQYNLADLASSFAAVGFWFEGGLTQKDKPETWLERLIRPTCNFIYGVPTSIFLDKQLEKVTKADAYKAYALVVHSSASDKEYTFLMNSYFPVLSELFYHAQTFCDGFIADVPVLGTRLLKAIVDGDSYSVSKFKEIVVQGRPDGLTSKDYTWFQSTGWSKYTAVLPHMTFRVSSQSSSLSDKIINDVNITKRFVVMAYANDKEIRPISRSFMKDTLVYIEPDDLMVSRDSSLQLVKAKVSDLSDSISLAAEKNALKNPPPKLKPDEIDNHGGQSRADSALPGHDEGIIDSGDPVGRTKDEAQKSKPFKDAGESEHTKKVETDKGSKFEETEKKKPYSPPAIEEKQVAGDIASGESSNNPTGTAVEEKKKKKIKRTKPDGSVEEIEVEADYKLGENESFIE
jgi:hypothetical protein